MAWLRCLHLCPVSKPSCILSLVCLCFFFVRCLACLSTPSPGATCAFCPSASNPAPARSRTPRSSIANHAGKHPRVWFTQENSLARFPHIQGQRVVFPLSLAQRLALATSRAESFCGNPNYSIRTPCGQSNEFLARILTSGVISWTLSAPRTSPRERHHAKLAVQSSRLGNWPFARRMAGVRINGAWGRKISCTSHA